MTVIRLTGPVASASAHERLALFPGRALGEDEFDRQQRYADARLAPLLAGRGPGIAHGFDVRFGDDSGADLLIGPGVAIAADGLAVALDSELRPRWCDVSLAESDVRLVPLPEQEASELGETGRPSAPDGHYVIALERVREERIAGSVDPELRTELDPLLDRRRELFARVQAYSVLIPGAGVETLRVRAANRACALLLPELRGRGAYAWIESRSIVLVLVAVQSAKVVWADGLALRRGLGPGAEPRALAEWFRSTLENALRALPPRERLTLEPEPNDLATQLASLVSLDFLPAAAQLPAVLLRRPTAIPHGGEPGPTLPLFEPDLGVELLPVRVADVPAILAREQLRPPVDRTRSSGERMRLLIGVRDTDWRGDLLDVPQVDLSVIDELHRAWVVAIEAWVDWKRELNARDFVFVDEKGLATLVGEPQITLDTAQRAALGLQVPGAPRPLPEMPSENKGLGLVEGIIARERAETQINSEAELPRPYNEPPPSADFRVWSQAEGNIVYGSRGQAAQSRADGEEHPDAQHALGTIADLAFQRRYRAALLSDEAEVERIVEGLRDHVSEHRQQLDSHTVNLAAVAGGVAADGSGMKIARWLPYLNYAPKPPVQKQVLAAPVHAEAAAIPHVGSQVFEATGAASVAAEASPIGIASLFSTRASQQLTNTLVLATAKTLPEKDTSAKFVAELVSRFNVADLAVNRDRAPVRPPAYVADDASFGVMHHIRPDVYVLEQARKAYSELFTRLSQRLERAEPAWKTAFAAHALSDERKLAPSAKDMKELSLDKIKAEFEKDQGDDKDPTSASYRGSVHLGQRHVDLIENAERVRAIWERVLRALVAEVDRCSDRIEELEAELPERHRAVAAARSALDETTEDYAMAQRLLIEDWQRVERLDEQRTFALTHPLGLWYVRSRRVPLGVPVADPLQLSWVSEGDVVPGCSEIHDDLPDVIDHFIDLVREAPLASFGNFVALVDALPDPARLVLLATVRSGRLASKYEAPVLAVPRMQGLLQSRVALLAGFRSVTLDFAALAAEARRRALLGLSMEDLLSGPPSAARREAERARAAWEQAASCFVASLRQVPAGIRYTWAQAAEDDRLALEQPGFWPNLAQVEDELGTAAARRLVELVAWMFRQLADANSDQGSNAVRLLVRACLIHVAHGEAGELLTGRITLPARRLATGVLLRAELSRAARPGTQLHLLDEARRVVGTVRVDDSDEQGTLVRVIARDLDVVPTTLFTLAAIRG